jgi:hypothetical protein
MGYDYYDRDDVTAYLAQQRQRIAELEAENQALRTQLNALARGEGIAVLINGRKIPLAAFATAASDAPRDADYSSAAPPSAPRDVYHHQAQRAPLPRPYTPPAPQQADGFPEDAWLTDSTPAARPAPAAQPLQRGHNTGAHALRPAERITPDWLREAHNAAPPAANRYPQDAWADSYGEPQFPTPAQRSGQRPAQRPPRRDPRERNPYADSFVLD